MKNKKIKLNDLKLESFVTTLTKEENKTIDGAAGGAQTIMCTMDAKPRCRTRNPLFC